TLGSIRRSPFLEGERRQHSHAVVSGVVYGGAALADCELRSHSGSQGEQTKLGNEGRRKTVKLKHLIVVGVIFFSAALLAQCQDQPAKADVITIPKEQYQKLIDEHQKLLDEMKEMKAF